MDYVRLDEPQVVAPKHPRVFIGQSGDGKWQLMLVGFGAPMMGMTWERDSFHEALAALNEIAAAPANPLSIWIAQERLRSSTG
jgi:hypothetical protein